MGANDEAYRDHRLRFSPLEGEALSYSAAVERIQTAFPDAIALVSNVDRLFDPASIRWAFGPDGEAGDEEVIRHLADRTIRTYRGWIDWGRDLRATRVPTDLQSAYHLAADLMRQPVEEMRSFVVETVAVVDSFADLPEDDEPIEVTLSLVVTMDSEAESAFEDELESLNVPDV